ncbi:MAG TPA: hypothetical protein VFT12_13150 [Thermoanaerobaculia bacterium]|nr:hypothetical protein [Thermoanaerobaculia bacterium]
MRTLLAGVVGFTLALATSVAGQTPEPEPVPPPAPPPVIIETDEIQTGEPEPAPAAVEPPPVLSQAAGSSYERREALPDVNIYVPEMQMSIRLRKLIRNALFESQIDYEFVDGDISTYLRYKYYARNYTYRIGVFDTIEFPSVGESSTQEFERVRGGLLLVGIPRDYDERYFWLLQGDNLTFGDLTNVDNKRKNFYTKFAYQSGTQFDERLNAIVGESRGRITPVLTAFRDIGPQRSSYAVALTQTLNITGGDLDVETDRFDYAIGDYRYTKLEVEGLRRFDVHGSSFIFSRAHLGLFAGYNEFTNRDERPEPERYSVPRYELFNLGGRDALRAIGQNDQSIGTHQFHITNEYFRPIFRNRDYRTGPLHWNTLYGILYLGTGTVGFGFDTMTKTSEFVVDTGIGFEASIGVRDFDVLLGVIWATTLKAPGPCPEEDASLDCRDLQGSKIRFSVRTVR